MKCQPPASEQVSQLLKVFRAILVFFSRKCSFNFCKGYVLLYSVSYSANSLNCVRVLEPNDKNLVSRITWALQRFATPTLKTVKRLYEFQREFWNTNISHFCCLSPFLMQTIPHSKKRVFVFYLRTAIYLSFENFPLFYTLFFGWHC